MRVLRLTLHKKWFDLIASGDKKIEFRVNKPYWNKRLDGKEFDEVHFTNGYGKNRPFMRVKCIGIYNGSNYCHIHLGEILEARHG